MPDAQPTHGIFIKYGRFHADAFGRPAVLTILLALVVASPADCSASGEIKRER
jgi:hypothetical protein